ncbi:unnamed protein product [Brassica oleracea var. botrytis]
MRSLTRSSKEPLPEVIDHRINSLTTYSASKVVFCKYFTNDTFLAIFVYASNFAKERT